MPGPRGSMTDAHDMSTLIAQTFAKPHACLFRMMFLSMSGVAIHGHHRAAKAATARLHE